jgi:hypothetical protein
MKKWKEAYEITLLSVCVYLWACPRIFGVFWGSWGFWNHLAVCVSPSNFLGGLWNYVYVGVSVSSLILLVFYAVRVVSKNSRLLVLPRTSCNIILSFKPRFSQCTLYSVKLQFFKGLLKMTAYCRDKFVISVWCRGNCLKHLVSLLDFRCQFIWWLFRVTFLVSI